MSKIQHFYLLFLLNHLLMENRQTHFRLFISSVLPAWQPNLLTVTCKTICCITNQYLIFYTSNDHRLFTNYQLVRINYIKNTTTPYVTIPYQILQISVSMNLSAKRKSTTLMLAFNMYVHCTYACFFFLVKKIYTLTQFEDSLL